MKLYFIKQAALKNFCNDAAPFEEFKTVKDFALSAETEGSRADFENCKILYSNLKFFN